MPVWEIVNPSDAYTIAHDRFEVCAAAAYPTRPTDAT
jgi:hypothetical protein